MSGIIDTVGSKSGIVGSDVYPDGHVIQTFSVKVGEQATDGTNALIAVNEGFIPKQLGSSILATASINNCTGTAGVYLQGKIYCGTSSTPTSNNEIAATFFTMQGIDASDVIGSSITAIEDSGYTIGSLAQHYASLVLTSSSGNITIARHGSGTRVNVSLTIQEISR